LDAKSVHKVAKSAARSARIWHNRSVIQALVLKSRARIQDTSMPMNANEIETLIKAGIPDATVTIRDLAGDGDHYAATVLAESFRGKSRVQQHQLVYNALKGQMGGALHALALQTGLPEG
jgi:stress-induced morphogen